MAGDVSMNPERPAFANRRRWTAPAVIDLPTLTDLTLQSAGGAPAGDAVTVTGGSGGLVF